MKKSILACSIFAIAITSFAQDQAASYVNEKLGQRERVLAKSGGDFAKTSYKTKGLEGLGVASSDCMESVKNGKQSPHYCLGLEAASKTLFDNYTGEDQSPLFRQVKTWFSPEKQKYRIYAYCMVFLKTTDQQCGVHYANAKMAVE
mgnify:CR=1 FL=1